MNFQVTIPATSANIGPGFDVWGMSLNLYNVFMVKSLTSEKSKFELSFEYGDLAKQTIDLKKSSLTTSKDSLLYKCYHFIFEKSGFEEIPIAIHGKINIPISRGLGSSSTAIIAGLLIGNQIMRHFHGFGYSIDELFQFACQLEGHPDNVAPALFGGLVVSVYNEKYKVYEYLKLPFVAPLKIAGVVPHISLSTELARSAVLRDIDLKHLIFHQGRMAILTHLFSKKNWQNKDYVMLETALQDLIHQTQRSKFIPGMLNTFKYWKDLGCLGSFLSGAGSTLLGFFHPNADVKSLDLKKVLKLEKVEANQVEFEFTEEGSFLENL